MQQKSRGSIREKKSGIAANIKLYQEVGTSSIEEYLSLVLIITTKFFEALIALFNLLPLSYRVGILWLILKIYVFFAPKYNRIALKNLKLISPDEEPSFYSETIRDSYWKLARVTADSLFLPKMTESWLAKRVKFERLDEWLALFNNPPPGLMILSAHIDSFELILRFTATKGGPMAFVYRNFNFKPLNDLWRKERERFGNASIDRNGAFRKILSHLSRGMAAGLVADQNVKRDHAVFRPFFGKLAATSKAVGVAAVKLKTPVVFVFIDNQEEEKYLIDWERFPVEKIYEDETLDFDAKVNAVTDLYLRKLEKEIKKRPAAWFLIHRRWKTMPEGVPEDFYA